MDHFSWKKVTDRIYLIVASYGPHHNVMQLLIGDREAAIIDTGMGATGDLRKLVETLTSLPVICFITHMHPDHAGAAMLFDRRYLNPADEVHCWWALTKEKRKQDLEDVCETQPELRSQIEMEMTDNSNFTYLPMYPGDQFDLGGVSLEVLAAEGHTEGSVVLFCKEENALFAGDAIAPKTILIGEHQTRWTPLRDVYEHMSAISKRTNADTLVFCGHATDVLPSTLVDDLLTALENVLSGCASKKLPNARFQAAEGERAHYEENVGGVSLIYSEASL
jgi:glyoxylase-like metal-dependent hydrolase (beta-lactamase superfamily II)